MFKDQLKFFVKYFFINFSIIFRCLSMLVKMFASLYFCYSASAGCLPLGDNPDVIIYGIQIKTAMRPPVHYDMISIILTQTMLYHMGYVRDSSFPLEDIHPHPYTLNPGLEYPVLFTGSFFFKSGYFRVSPSFISPNC